MIFHAGTYNILKQTNPENLGEEVVSALHDMEVNQPKA